MPKKMNSKEGNRAEVRSETQVSLGRVILATPFSDPHFLVSCTLD
jgi:hypothetical protein